MTEPEMEAGSQGRTARLVGFFASLVASLFLWFLLATRFPIGKVLAYWFWKPTTAPRPAWWLIFLAITCMLGLILFVRRSKLSIAANLVVIILVGFALQHAFGLMEGRGLSGVRDRMLRAGHTSFARDAVKKMDLLEVARDYEELIERRELSRYPNSTKPPGQLLVYMLTERISRAFPQLGTNALLRMATLASLLYPFLTYLTVIPLYALSRLHLDGKAAYVPAVVFLCLPNVTLMSLHLDQCLYPLLFTSALALFSYGYRQQGTLLLVLSGVATCVALYVSFSLVVIFPLVFASVALGHLNGFRLAQWRESGIVRREGLKCSITALVLFVVGFALGEAVLFLFLDYRIVGNLVYVISNRRGWPIQDPTASLLFYIGWLDIVEYVVWIGLPVAWLAASRMVISWSRICRGATRREATAAACLLIILLLAFFGRTFTETARLWLFLTPLLALFATGELISTFGRRYWAGLASLATVQMFSIFAIKLWQDFF
jgi:hypothetical protein